MHGNTDVAPYDMGTLGSRSTFHMGNAVKLAAEDAKRESWPHSPPKSGLPAGTNYDVKEIFRKRYGMQAGNVIGVGTYVPRYTPPDPKTGQSDNVTPFWMVGGTGVEVEVDTETGHLRVMRMVNVADAGKPINPKICKTQLSGGAIMQLGFTLYGGHGVRRRPGDQRVVCRLQDSGLPRRAGDGIRAGVGDAGNRPVRRKGNRRDLARSASRPQSPTPSTMRSASDRPSSRSRPEAVLRAMRAAEGRPLAEDE